MMGKRKVEVEVPVMPSSTEIEVIVMGENGLDVKGKTMIVAFPSVGYAGLIAGHYIVEKLGLEYVGTFLSDYIPGVATIHNAVPYYPIKIFMNPDFIVLLSEFVPVPPLTRSIVKTLFDKFINQGIEKLVLLEGLMLKGGSSLEGGENRAIYGIGVKDEVNKEIERHGIELLKDGMITGISGMLLSEAYLKKGNVVCFLAEANPMYPDARAAATLIEGVMKIESKLKVDLSELLENAKEIENNVKNTLMKAKEIMDAQQKGMKGKSQRITLPMYG